MRRLNLLPRERRLLLRKELALSAVRRLMMTICIALLLLSVVNVLGGGSLWLFSVLNGRAAEDELTQQMADYIRVQQEATRRNQLLQTVDKLGRERLVWSEVLLLLWPTLPPGATVENVAIDSDQRTVTITGTAAQRTTLVVFEDRLRRLPWVSHLDAPRENLLRKENANYTYALRIDPAKLLAAPPHAIPTVVP